MLLKIWLCYGNSVCSFKLRTEWTFLVGQNILLKSESTTVTTELEGCLMANCNRHVHASCMGIVH